MCEADGALLGLATTRELLDELRARAVIGQLDDGMPVRGEELEVLERASRVFLEALSEPVLEYRTVGRR